MSWIGDLHTHGEEALLSSVSTEAPWSLIEAFSELVRESGSEDERRAFELISERLTAFGVPHRIYRPTLFASVPRTAQLEMVEPEFKTFTAKTASMSTSTNGSFQGGPLMYVPSAMGGTLKEMLASYELSGVDPEGKVILTEGVASPAKVFQFMSQGARGAVFINPGQRVHESICTTVWGTPDLDSWERRNTIPVLSINAEEGAWLREKVQAGPAKVRFSTFLDAGWVESPLCVAEILGTRVPEEFVLVHGHVDSWHAGVGDNATGDAALMEIARVLWNHRSQLDRSVRIAWWPGHSQGRYAGSAWFADTFALEIDEYCIAHINCDSPGCKWATAYDDVFWMTETEDIAKAAIRDVAGIDATGARPIRAGDKSFSNIGVSTFYMLSSTIPRELAAEKGYFQVGGCGGNIVWHTEDDNLDIADPENLLRDIRVYLLATLRTANAPIHPLDFSKLTEELEATLRNYQEASNSVFDLQQLVEEVQLLRKDLDEWYSSCDRLLNLDSANPEVRRANSVLRQLSRLLVPVNYTRSGRFQHDPAIDVPGLPDLAPALSLKDLPPGSDGFYVTLTHLVRGRNRVTAAIRAARSLLNDFDRA